MNSMQRATTFEPEEIESFFFFTDLELEMLLRVQKRAAQRNNHRPLEPHKADAKVHKSKK